MDFPSVIVFIAWLLGGFVSGLTGIGGAMLAVPLAAMFIPMHDVILLSCILNLAMDGTLTCIYLRHCRFSALAPLLAGAIPGAFIGLVILQAVSGRILQGGVGLLLLSYVCWQFFARRSGRERSSWAVGSIAGLGAGVLGTAISFDGPPAGAYALWCGWEPRQALGTLGVFFVLRSLITCSLQAWSGLYTEQILTYAAYGFPACVLGVLCAFPVVRRVRGEIFRRFVMAVVAAGGLVCLWNSFH